MSDIKKSAHNAPIKKLYRLQNTWQKKLRKRKTHTRAHVHSTHRLLTGGRHASVNVNASEIRISPLQYNLYYNKYFLKTRCRISLQ